MPQVQFTEKLVNDTVLYEQVQQRAVEMLQIRQSDENSSCATDSTETDADCQEDPEDCRDPPRCAETVPIIQEIQKIVEVSFMDEVVEVPVVMKGRCARFRRAEDLDVATDPEKKKKTEKKSDGHFCPDGFLGIPRKMRTFGA